MEPHRSVRFLAVLAALGLGPAPRAAEITRVLSSADPESPLGIEFSVRFERAQERAKITQEFADSETQAIEDGNALRYERTSNRLVPRLAIGLYRDLELHAEMPYVLSDDASWDYGGTDAASSTIANNRVNPDGGDCGAACPIFPVPQTVAHGKLGDLELGLAWGILSQRRDDTKPTWLVGLDVTLPTAEKYDPGDPDERQTNFSSSFSSSSNRAPVGAKIWAFDVYTALSRRMGLLEPYVKAHLRLSRTSSSTYSNCDHAQALTDAGQMASIAPANCALAQWKTEAGAKLPVVAGLLFGTEIVPYENASAGQKLSADLRLGIDYVSSGRWYNELTDATGKLLATGEYLTLGGRLGVSYQISRAFELRAAASFENALPHFLTGESEGKNPGEVPATDANRNPNFDWRYDAPGRRFRISEVYVFGMNAALLVHF